MDVDVDHIWRLQTKSSDIAFHTLICFGLFLHDGYLHHCVRRNTEYRRLILKGIIEFKKCSSKKDHLK
jgi:hypothetical protein